MEVNDILDFLPKYPNIQPFQETILNPYNVKKDSFNEIIFRKKEFYDEKLEETEEFPDQVGNLMKHQKIIARFFSSYTPYNSLLLLHEMGTGKSCSAVGAIEQIKKEGRFRGALYLAKGETLIGNFINEIVYKCTDGVYIPEEDEEITRIKLIRREKKALKSFYQFGTFETFAKKIRSFSSDKTLQDYYNNYIIVLDEIHNIRIKDKVHGLDIYDQFNRFLHVVQNCKILLLSGTPMKDGVDEIASVMNLILPLKEKVSGPGLKWAPTKINYLPTGNEFLTEFFNKKAIVKDLKFFDEESEKEQNNDIFVVKPDKKSALKAVFKGRVSYLRAMQSNVTKIFEGIHIGTLKYLNVVPDIMSEFQSKYYKKAFDLDKTGKEKRGIYQNSRQASLFVFPDGLYGKEGAKIFIEKRSKKGLVVRGESGKANLAIFSLRPKLRDALRGDSDEERLVKLQKYSCIYAASMRNILNAQMEGKCVFVYNEFVEGSGLILFGLILELFGFSFATGDEREGSYARRFALLTNITSNKTQISKIVHRFNQADNVRGKVINIIIGSRKISEGFSFKNIQTEEIQTPWYNYSETSQAIARGYRLGSHRELLKVGVLQPVLTIYQRVAIPNRLIMSERDSIDLYMYELAENKDISIKGVERLIKEAAFDCALNYNRNHVVGKDGERECEYTDCNYICDGIPPELLIKKLNYKDLDYSTYQLYYSADTILKIIRDISILFRNRFSIDLATLNVYFDEYTQFELLTALYKIINENTPITNKYGFVSYIKEENNIFFLVDSLSVKGNFSSDYYTKFPFIKKPVTFDQILISFYDQTFPIIVEQVCRSRTIEELSTFLVKLPINIQEQLLEASILAREKNIPINTAIRELILKYFTNRYGKIQEKNGTEIWISWLLFEKKGIIRCLRGIQWEDCSDEFREQIEQEKKEVLQKLESNRYGYYGQYNKEDKKFCIRNVISENPEQNINVRREEYVILGIKNHCLI